MNETEDRSGAADIVIAGAGLSGVCAAVTAARRGARVMLIERDAAPGGTAAGLRQRFLCGLFGNASDMPRACLNPGLSDEIMARMSPNTRPQRMGQVWLLPYEPVQMVKLLATLLKAEKNIIVKYSSTITSCRLQDDRISVVRYICRGRSHNVEGSAFIDAGAGILLEQSAEAQPAGRLSLPLAGFALDLGGVDWDEMLPVRVPYVLYGAVQRGELPVYARWTAASFDAVSKSVQLKVSLPAGKALSAARQMSRVIVKILRQELPAFRSAALVWQATRVFARDGVRLRGKYILKDKDVITGKSFNDGVIKGAWPVEFWDPRQGPTYRYCRKDHYELPLRSLVSRNVSNLLAAGRSVSAEPGALASLRVGGLCLATGEAAGRAAIDLGRKML
ncbi:MAG: FAD-dependent oxidoreductase [Candidatus Omnitrophica bacterium]|nr:FAD-dependent oxidoreductase [Candidatus Omnitrophota bacterium]